MHRGGDVCDPRGPVSARMPVFAASVGNPWSGADGSQTDSCKGMPLYKRI